MISCLCGSDGQSFKTQPLSSCCELVPVGMSVFLVGMSKVPLSPIVVSEEKTPHL
jgi:hypothetical protein